MSTREILDKIFKKPDQSYGLDEFSAIHPEDVLEVFEKEKGKFYLKCLKRNKDLLVWNEERQAGEPEEIVRQLWLYKLVNEYNYPLNRIEVEVNVDFGREVHEKAADIVVYQENKQTAWIILEIKSPEAKDGLEQIKSYLNAKGGPLGILSDGRAKIILYRPYPHQFENTLRDIPKADQTIQDVLEETLTVDDLEPNYDLVKIIKILEELVLAGAGVDSFNDYTKDTDNERGFRYFNFDLLLTNPPFAGEIIDRTLLTEYELAKNDKGKLRNKMERHILFVERALNLIKPGGRLAIVLPQGVLNNTNMQYIRQFLFDKARILAVVGLDVNTFKPHTGTKTSVLFLQKWAEKEKPMADYPIFMAVSKKSGKDNSGDYIYKKDADRNFAYDAKGRRVLDHDLDQIADAFEKFAEKQGFSFWR